MAWSLQWYQNSVLAWMWDPTAQQAMQRETPWFDMFANVKTDNVAWMDMLSPTERQTQQYDSNRLRAEALNKEVEIWLGSRIDKVMSDADKQRYLNGLTKSQYQQMLKYKNEGYWFMASKELLENQYKLSDPNATWIMKYKDYAGKDAYYNNNADTISSSLWDKYVANPIWWLARYWNETLGYGEDAQKGNMSFADKFANLTLGNIINWLDAYANAESRIMNTAESWVKALYDRVVKGYDTDFDFYDKDREEKLVDEVIDAAFWAGQSAMWAFGLLPWAAPFTAALSTTPWEVLWGLTLEWIAKWADLILDNTPMARQAYRYLSPDSQDKLTTWLAMILIWKVAKWGKAKLDAKATPYLNAAKWIIKNWLEKGIDYAKAQAWFEEFSKVKWWREGSDGTFVETENYNPWYRGRVAKEFWEWFKEWVKEKYNNPDWTEITTQSEFGSTTQQWQIPWTEKTTWAGIDNKTTVDNTQQWWIVNTIWTSQLRQWNKMNKAQAVKFFNKYGTDYGNWMAQRWFNQSYDNNINALWDYAEYVQGQKADVLGTIRQRYNDPRVDDMLSDALAKAEYIKSPDLSKIESLALKNSQGWLTPQDVDWLRQWFGYNVPLRFDGTDVSGTVARNNNIYTAVREFLEEVADENGFSQLRDLNREIAATHHIIEATTRYYNWVATNDTVSLKDLVTLAWAMANPKAWPVVIMQQVIKVPSVQDAILKKLIKGKTTTERNQIKIDLDKIKKIQDEAEQRRMLEEWIAKWNLKVEEATRAMSNRLPENITQWGVVAWDRGIVSPNPSSPTYQEMGLGNIRETASPQYLLRAIVEQLKQSNLIKDLNTAEAVNSILANLSPEAQAKLATISQKLASWQQLTAEEWRIIEKIADVIRQDQDTITDVQQPWLFDWLDNPEWTDINNTNLPTNPTNNGGNNSWIVEQGKGETLGDNKPTTWWELDWGRSEGSLWEIQSWLWERNQGIEEDIQEITDISEAENIIDSIWDRSMWWLHIVTPSEWNYRTFVNPERTVAISIDGDKIIDYVQDNDAPTEAWDQLILKAIEEWAKRLDADTQFMVEHFERFWFKPLVRDGNGKYLLAHNGDAVDVVRDNIWKYNKHKLNRLQILKVRWAAEKFRNKFMEDNYWKELGDIEWWDGLKNYENFDTKFDSESKIKDYIDNSFEYIDSVVSPETETVFNKAEALATQIYNWHISYKDTWLVYENGSEWLRQRFEEKKDGKVYWLYSRKDKQLALWIEDWETAPHETLHLILFKSGLELTWREIELADLASKMIDAKYLPRREDTVIWKLLWEFADIYRDIKYRSMRDTDIRRVFWTDKDTLDYYNDPSEHTAMFWEAFSEFVQWREPVSELWVQFPKWLCVRFAKWLGNMDIARVKWELHSWELWTVTHKRLISPYIDWVGTVRDVWEDFDKSTFLWNNKSMAIEIQDRRWYHWSPASFDKFDSTHMGEWEWAQAHWWGHYIAIEEGTARHYGGMNESNTWWVNFILDGKPYKEVYNTLDEFEKDAFDSFKAYRLNDYEFWEAWDTVKERSSEEINNRIKQDESFINYLNERMEEKPEETEQLKNMIEDTKKHLEKYKAKKSELSKIDDLRKRSSVDNNLYEVEIPDPIEKDTPTWSNYLEEDATIGGDDASRFSRAIRDYVRDTNWNTYLNDIASELELDWKMEFISLRKKLEEVLWAKWTSKFLESLGYDWIHYVGGRDWEAYVIFNDDIIDIVNHRTL